MQSSTQYFLTDREKQSMLHQLFDSGVLEYSGLISSKNRNVAFEFLRNANEFVQEGTNQIIFGKLSQKRDVNDFQWDDINTGLSEEVSSPEGKEFASKSYFLLDTSDFTLSYCRGAMAPTVLAFRDMISNLTNINEYQQNGFRREFGEIDLLSIPDGFELLKHKKDFGLITYSIEVPAKTPRNLTGLGLSQQRKLKNQGRTTIDVKVRMEKRKKSMFSSIDDLKEYIDDLTTDDHMKDIRINARDSEAEKFETISLQNNPYIQHVEFDFDEDHDTVRDYENRLADAMIQNYLTHKDEINRYLGNND
ncbi:hypothetical protein FD35_GL002557 [Furfurilactobacillus rossiae DSM 15814]|uniref:Uncharacterized protein n=1 Tax=Furfurilactobacillus rossiae DSM 15814 TaxID=1114972 RepID=A0A0R1RDN5_9LACO|nr:hypothetical protein FD35_GL002557 [Furfurilactobacillus rossiae DSM 15814]